MNRVYINLRKEVELDRDFKEVSAPTISVYIHCDSISSWLGNVDCEDDVLDLISPKNLNETMTETLSGDELEVFEALLDDGTQYSYYDLDFTYRTFY